MVVFAVTSFNKYFSGAHHMLCSGNYVDRGPVIIHGLQDQDGEMKALIFWSCSLLQHNLAQTNL